MMPAFGTDFLGGRRRLYGPSNPAGLWVAIAIAVGLVILNQLLQSGFGVASVALLGGSFDDAGDVIKGFMVGLFPAAILTVAAALFLTRLGGGSARQVLCLRWPQLGFLGWAAVILGFLVFMYGLLIATTLLLNVDLSQYQPTEGEDNAEQIGMVKQAMFDIAHDPKLFLLVLPSVVIGAPFAEEVIFRGQLFAALSQSRIGLPGATVATSALWALLHATEPWFSIAIIFVMGLVFGYLLWRFGSLWVTIICHAVWNGIYSLIMFASVSA